VTTRLGKLLRLLASDKSGEVVAAASAINRALKAEGLDIHHLAEAVERTALAPRKASSPAPDNTLYGWQVVRRFCLEHRGLLRGRELEFLDDLGDWRRDLTTEQWKWLEAIYARLKRTTGNTAD
jgi:hypothetical protein